jgi:hypothetical protein
MVVTTFIWNHVMPFRYIKMYSYFWNIGSWHCKFILLWPCFISNCKVSMKSSDIWVKNSIYCSSWLKLAICNCDVPLVLSPADISA